MDQSHAKLFTCELKIPISSSCSYRVLLALLMTAMSLQQYLSSAYTSMLKKYCLDYIPYELHSQRDQVFNIACTYIGLCGDSKLPCLLSLLTVKHCLTKKR